MNGIRLLYLPQAKRSDAVTFFFELLVLKTRGYVGVEQTQAYGDIKLRPESKLFATAK